MHQNSIIYRTYGGIGIGQKFAAECGIKHKFVAEWRNGRPRKTPPCYETVEVGIYILQLNIFYMLPNIN